MAIVKKISELTPKGSNLGTTDLLIVGVDNGTDYDLKSVTGAQLLGTVVSQTITDGVTTKSPSENVVYDNLALKVDKVTGSRLITSAESTILSNTSGVNSGDQDLSNLVIKNTSITGATKTKITYDSKGLVTSGTDATTSDIADSTNKRYVTDTEKTNINYLNTVASNVQDQLNAKVNLNTLITPSTGTKITYDAKGLILSSTNITTSDVSGLGSLATQSGTFSGTSSGTNTGDQTFLNARVQSVTSSAIVTPTNLNDLVIITAQVVGLTLANPTGTFTEGQALMVRIKDNGTARTIAFDTNYRAIGVTLPTTTVISKTLYLGIIYNSTDSKWDVIGYNIQA